jgi:polyisoprenoid-binding protein YceI
MTAYSRFFILSIIAVGINLTSSADARPFKTLPEDSRNLVQFTSQATMESFTGRTSKIKGQVDFNLDSLPATSSGSFEVDVSSMDTGIKMRNKDMRTKFLETDKYPKATFTLKRFMSSDKTALLSGESAQVVAEGDLTIHGVAKTYQIPLTLRYIAHSPQTEGRLNGGTGDLLFVSGNWKVKLPDHDIKMPQLFFMRVAEEQDVSLDFALTDQ